MAAANGLIDAAEATRNPWALSLALWAYGTAFRDADPVRAREAMRRGLVIAQDSGNRTRETYLAASLARLEAEHGDPLAALDYFTVAIRNFHDSGNTTRSVPPWLPSPPFSTGSDATKCGYHQPDSPSALLEVNDPEISTAIAHLREVLGDETYESLPAEGETDDHRRDGRPTPTTKSTRPEQN